ncbi:MAG: ABC transporter permease [Dehalococcoidales bacterium]
MILRLIKLDKVAAFGSVIGLISLLAGWLTLRPNRLVSSPSTSLWGSFGNYGAVSLVVLWLICLVLSLSGLRNRRGLLLGITANAILILTLVLVGFNASRLSEAAPEIARVSISSGVWLTLAGAYVLIYAARQNLQKQRTWYHLISWGTPVVLVILLATGWLNQVSILEEFHSYRLRFFEELFRHIRLFGSGVIAATIIGIPLGVWATRNRYAEKSVFFITNIVQTIPSLALFGFMIAPLSALSFALPWLRDLGITGVGPAPAVIALTIYSLLPVVRNTYVGIRQVDAGVIDAGLGMGMSRWQVFRRVEVPLAAPLALEGIRTASVQAVGLATLAQLIGAFGLGWFVFTGIGAAAPDMIILGAIPIILLALLVDGIMRKIVRISTPKGLIGAT